MTLRKGQRLMGPPQNEGFGASLLITMFPTEKLCGLRQSLPLPPPHTLVGGAKRHRESMSF